MIKSFRMEFRKLLQIMVAPLSTLVFSSSKSVISDKKQY